MTRDAIVRSVNRAVSVSDDVWIRDSGALAAWVASWTPGPVAVDLEADSFHHYREKVCLAQVSIDRIDRLVDPLAGADLRALRAPFEDRGRRKVLHGADYDLRMLDRDFGLRVAGLFDTMIAARLLGERSFGLAAMLEREFEVRLDKSHQRADWSRRPLPEPLVRYALEDTRHLIRLADRLEERLRGMGRTNWAEEEFRRLEDVRWTSSGDDPDAFRKVKGARGLDRRGWTVIRALHGWRDDRARRRDVPPFRVAGDAVLVGLARQRPRAIAALSEIEGLPRSLAAGAAARSLLDAIAQGLEAEPVSIENPSERRPRGVGVDEARLRRFRKIRDRVAAGLDLEPSVVLPRKVLEEVAERAERGEAWTEAPGLRTWQAGLVADAVREIWAAEPGL